MVLVEQTDVDAMSSCCEKVEFKFCIIIIAVMAVFVVLSPTRCRC